jgi:hypothetical protein
MSFFVRLLGLAALAPLYVPEPDPPYSGAILIPL